jgi:hypothetical protein
VLGGGTFVLDAAIDRVERAAEGWRVRASGTTRPGRLVLEVDDVIAATGFRTPLLDLPDLGVATFYQGGRLPAQTPYWESPTVPGIYFAGSATQGSLGLRKYGMPSNSAAVHGFRYNARILARHIAERHFGAAPLRRELDESDVVPHLLRELTAAPELWNQQSYLASMVTFERDHGILDRGTVPLAAFVDETGPDAVAVAVETDPEGDIHPAVYVRQGGSVREHQLPSEPLNRFDGEEHRLELGGLLAGLS